MKVEPLAGALGAEVTGVDLAADMSADLFDEVYGVFVEHSVVFFPNQSLTTVEHRDFAARFGELDIPVFAPPFETPAVDGHPEIYQLVKQADDRSVNLGGFWHADVTHRETPHLGSIVFVREAPAVGGDTLFSNLHLAYETLSDGLKTLLESMQAVHSSAMPFGGGSVRNMAVSRTHVPAAGTVQFDIDQVEGGGHVEAEHPVVRRHPDSGRKSLYVNRGFTSHFAGWTVEESAPLLNFLWTHSERPEFTCRYRWRAGTLGIWDNRCVHHYALNDYYGERRVLHRISITEAARPSA